jgi:hypothetical protein
MMSAVYQLGYRLAMLWRTLHRRFHELARRLSRDGRARRNRRPSRLAAARLAAGGPKQARRFVRRLVRRAARRSFAALRPGADRDPRASGVYRLPDFVSGVMANPCDPPTDWPLPMHALEAPRGADVLTYKPRNIPMSGHVTHAASLVSVKKLDFWPQERAIGPHGCGSKTSLYNVLARRRQARGADSTREANREATSKL